MLLPSPQAGHTRNGEESTVRLISAATYEYWVVDARLLQRTASVIIYESNNSILLDIIGMRDYLTLTVILRDGMGGGKKGSSCLYGTLWLKYIDNLKVFAPGSAPTTKCPWFPCARFSPCSYESEVCSLSLKWL